MLAARRRLSPLGKRRAWTGPATPIGLALLAFAVAFAQRPGRAFWDTRIELSVDPGLFLHRVASVWSGTTDLGHVQSGQFVGYLFPMGAWYALADLVGMPTWIAERIWLGVLMALAAWGAVRLMDALFPDRRGWPHVVAGLLYGFNPYIVVSINRGSVVLLAYAALPWLMLAVHRGLDDPRGWPWPAVVGLLLAASGGGVNAAVVAWVLLGPLALLVYETAVIGRGRRAALEFAWRAALCGVLGSLWWAIPGLLQGIYGADFLSFTEQPRNIWATNSMSESLRLLGFWLSYLGVGFGNLEPVMPAIGTYLFNPAVIIATFLVPLAAFGALRWTRGWSYAPFFGLLAAGAAVVMSAGFPDGAPMRRILTWAYENVGALQFLRTTYKVAPLLALSVACLGGAAVTQLLAYLRSRDVRIAGSRVPTWSVAALAVVPVLWALPLFKGQAVSNEVTYDHVPRAWRSAIADAERSTPPDRRIAIVPGELFGWYRWGGTWDSVGPALSDRPLLIRQASRYADPRSSQLLDAVDDLVQQGRLVPGQLGPLLRLMAVGQVIVPADTRRLRSGSVEPARAELALAGQGLDRPLGRYGAERTYRPERGRGGPAVVLPDLRRYPAPEPGAGIVRLHPVGANTLIDGDAEGVAELAAYGDLADGSLHYGADVGKGEFRDLVGRGARLVFTDTDRRRVVVASRLSEDHGPTLGQSDPIAHDWPTYDLFPGRGAGVRTVAVYSGLRYLRAPQSPGFSIFPEQRPFAALDGRVDTAWIADTEKQSDRYLDLALRSPRPVAAIRVHPHADEAGRTARLGISVNGGAERAVKVARGWNRIPLNERALRTLRIHILSVRGPVLFPGKGGIDELEIPGLRVRESLRLPTDLAGLGRGLDLSHNEIDVLLQRTTADFPYRAGANAVNPQQGEPIEMVDGEPGLVRDVNLPAGRRFQLVGWASVDPAGPDPDIDRLAGMPPGWRFASSSRFEGIPSHRASSAFDGDRATAWVGDRAPRAPAPFLSWGAPRSVAVDHLRVLPGGPEYERPSRVRVSPPGVTLRVGPAGLVTLPQRVRTKAMRIEVLNARAPRSPSERRRHLRAVAVAELEVPGLSPPRVRRQGRFATRCGELSVSGARSRATARVSGRLEEVDRGGPLRLKGCGPTSRLELPAGTTQIESPPGRIMRPDHLRLVSPAPAAGSGGGPIGVVVDSGHGNRDRRDGVKLDLRGPAWLVLGESYSRGWRAWCRGADGSERALGAPEPIDGFANGWRVGANCRKARFAFAPQRFATWGYFGSIAACLAMLGLLLVGVRRRGVARASVGGQAGPELPPDPRRSVAWAPAIALGAVVGAVSAVLFAVRAGVVLGPLAAVLVRDGVSARRLLALAAAGIAALPVLYVAFPAADFGGFNFDYSVDNIGAHWVAVGVVLCIGTASALEAWRLRSRGR